MAGTNITIGADLSVFARLKAKASETAKHVQDAFVFRAGQKIFDGALEQVKKLPDAIKEAVDMGAKLQDMMNRTGAKGQGLVVLQQMFKNAGSEAEAVPKALNKMQKALAGVNEDGEPTGKVFAEIGLSVSELMAMDPALAFGKVAEAIARIENPAKRSEVAMRIFGKTGGELLAVMNNPEAFAEAQKQVGGLADTLTENAAEFHRLKDNVEALHIKVLQLAAGLMSELAPALDGVGKKAAGTDLTGYGKGIGTAVKATVEGGADIVKFLDKVSGVNLIPAIHGIVSDPAGAISSQNQKNRDDLDPAKIAKEAVKPEDIAKKLEELEKKRAELKELAAQVMNNPDVDPAEISNAKVSLESGLTELDAIAKKLRGVTKEQMAANQATRDAAMAEAEHAALIDKTVKAYEALSQRLEEAKKKTIERAGNRESSDTGQVTEAQMNAAKKELADVQAKFSQPVKDLMGAGFSGTGIADSIKNDPDPVRRDSDTKNLIQAMEAADRLADLQKKQADEAAKLAKSREEATATYASELAILQADIAGSSEKVRQLKKEEEIRTKIAELVKAGIANTSVDGKDGEATRRAKALADAKEQAVRAGAVRAAQGTVLDAEALAKGTRKSLGMKNPLDFSPEEKRAMEKRSKELFDSGGLSKDESDNAARNENLLDKLKEVRSKSDGLQVRSSVSAVDSMQRIGGGGGVASNGLDYARQMADYQRQTVEILTAMHGKMPGPI